jgi:hypothetical protein
MPIPVSAISNSSVPAAKEKDEKEAEGPYRVSAAEFTAPPPAARGAQPQRPQMAPGSFKVVVYEMASASGK